MAARTRSFFHSPGRAPRTAATANMPKRKRRNEIAHANVCVPRHWRREAVWLAFIITPREITTIGLCRQNAATGEERFYDWQRRLLFAVHVTSAGLGADRMRKPR